MAAAHEDGGVPQPNLENLDAYFDIGVSLDHDGVEIGVARDYHALYREQLRVRDLHSPMRADDRLWEGSAPGRTAAQSARTNRAA